MENKKIRIIRKIYQSDQADYYIYKTQSLDPPREDLIITGNLQDLGKGEILNIKGESYQHPKFGHQFKVMDFSVETPTDNLGIIKYLSSPRFKGIGEKTATKIVKHFAENAVDIIEKTSTVLAIDVENRKATVKDHEGKVSTVDVHPEFKNLEKVKVGDQVVYQVTEAIAVDIKKVEE